MTVIQAPLRRSFLVPILIAFMALVPALWLQQRFNGGLGTALIGVLWWLLLPALAWAAAPERDHGWHRALAAGAAIWLHGAALVCLLALTLHRWWQAPSLSATLLVASAGMIATLACWRLWPALVLALLERDRDPVADPAQPRRLPRALRAAAALTAEHDVFIGRGLPVLLLHGGVLLLPGLLLVWPAPGWLGWVTAVVVALAAAMFAYRFMMAQVASLLMPAQDAPAVAAEAALEPIPEHGLLRAAALRQALRDGVIDRALAILAAGVDPLAAALPDEADQRDALIIAATLNDSRPLRAMIAAGADVNHRAQQLTPLLAATRDSYYGRAEIVLALLANGADLRVADEVGRTPLHHAALSMEPAVAVMLIEAGAAVDCLDADGHTPLARACAAGNHPLIAVLIERRASLAPVAGVPALCAAAAGANDDPELIARLLRAKAPIDARDRCAASALHHAVNAGHAGMVAALLAAGADVDARDQDGRTPLHWASAQVEPDAGIAAALRSAGADAQLPDNDGVTAASLQSRRGPADAERGAAAAVPDDSLTTLVHEAGPAVLHDWLRHASDEQRAALVLEAAVQGAGRALADALVSPLPVDARLPDGRGLVDAALAAWPLSQPLLRALPFAAVAVSGGGFLARLLSLGEDAVAAREAIALAWLEAGADPFADPAGASPLHHAVALGMENLSVRLLERGVDARVADRNGVTALHLALRHDDERARRLSLLLLRHGADPEAAASSGETPLGLALDADRSSLIDGLRWRGWRLPGRRLAGHDLAAAAQVGDLQAVRRLLLLGLPLEARDRQGCTAAIRAAGGGHRELLDELLKQGADLQARASSGVSVLAAAVIAGHVEIVRRLLDHGVAVEQRCGNEATVLIIAAACGALASIDLLLARGADVSATDQADNTALHAAAGYAFGSNNSVVARSCLLNLLSAGAQADAVNGAGLTPLHVVCGAAAATRPNPVGIDAALDVLLTRSTALTALDRHGCTPLHYAAAQGQMTAVQRLLARGADAHRRDHGGWRAEDYALRYGYTDVAQALRATTPTAPLPLRPG